MPMESVVGGGFTFSICSIGGNWRWKVVVDNIPNTAQQYYVSEIETPFGLLQDTLVKIPSEVIQGMADSLNQFQQQLAPLLALVGSSTFNATVTEGDPNIDIGVIAFTNAGAFGSSMSVTITPDVPWLLPVPSSANGIGKNQSAQSTARANPALMLATNSPYVGHLNLQDNRNPPTIIPTTFNVTVLPKPAITISPLSITLSYDILTQTPGGALQVMVSNSGPLSSILNFIVAKLQNSSPWLAFTPSSGGPLASGASTPITFSVVSTGVTAVPGTYQETIQFISNNASNTPVSMTVNLVVSLWI